MQAIDSIISDLESTVAGIDSIKANVLDSVPKFDIKIPTSLQEIIT